MVPIFGFQRSNGESEPACKPERETAGRKKAFEAGLAKRELREEPWGQGQWGQERPVSSGCQHDFHVRIHVGAALKCKYLGSIF